jgi:hypothetical protein
MYEDKYRRANRIEGFDNIPFKGLIGAGLAKGGEGGRTSAVEGKLTIEGPSTFENSPRRLNAHP